MASDARISRALVATKRVGDLLLRQEEAEAKQVKQLAEELVRSEHVVPSRPVPCTAERDACVGCYQHNAADPLKCAQQVKAYSTCATAAFMRVAKTK